MQRSYGLIRKLMPLIRAPDLYLGPIECLHAFQSDARAEIQSASPGNAGNGHTMRGAVVG